jgi:ornithine cyclodeaminase/alanine dehydrogenase-like protein (mu-crystallin family)
MWRIRSNGNFPGNPGRHGLPTVQGTIYLPDGRDGTPLAIMDSIGITIARTGAATAVAATYLACSDAQRVLICGAGVQGRIQLRAIKHACPIEQALVYDINGDAAAAFAHQATHELGKAAVPMPSDGVRQKLTAEPQRQMQPSFATHSKVKRTGR